jgi:hypothetical protein
VKRLTKHQREKVEKDSLSKELALIALGAIGGGTVEDDPGSGCGIYQTIGAEAFSRFMGAVIDLWAIGRRVDPKVESSERKPWMAKASQIHCYESLEKATAYLYDAGARAGGRWAE